MRLISLILVGLVFLQAGCGRRPDASASKMQLRPDLHPPAELAKVKVSQDGEIFLDGKPTTMEDLKRELSRLKQVDGGVWYYAEDPSSPESGAVKRALIDSHLPIKLTPQKFE